MTATTTAATTTTTAVAAAATTVTTSYLYFPSGVRTILNTNSITVTFCMIDMFVTVDSNSISYITYICYDDTVLYQFRFHMPSLNDILQ
jgi:hypothetical protein